MHPTETLLSESGFVIGEWTVSPAEGLLSQDGKTVHLEPKVMEVLVYLASRPMEVVSRAELEHNVWPRALVSDDAVTATVIKLRKALEDSARQPRIIVTIPKRGYQLIAPVRRFDAKQTGEPPSASGNNTDDESAHITGQRRAARRKRARLIGIGVTAIVAVVAAFLVYDPVPTAPHDEEAKGLSNKVKAASVVILPLKNLSGDPRHEYFSDGITDDITTALSQVASLRVIAARSAERYKNTNTSLPQIARDLDVNYVVEGSVQKAGNKLRIIAQLTDVGKNRLIWAERFDRDVKDVFLIQDEITRRVADNMLLALDAGENKYVPYRPTDSFAAYDTFLQAQQYSRNRSREDFELALQTYRRVLAIDPKFGRAYGAMAVMVTLGYRLEWTNSPLQESRERDMQLARKAAELDQSSPQVYWALGYVHLFRREFAEAEAAARQSITLSRSYADGFGLLAFINNWRGNAKEAERHIRQAISLNPYHTFEYPWNLGLSYYTQGRYEEATAALQNALEINETAYFPRLFLAASYARLGRVEDAKWEIEQINTQRPGTTRSFLAHTLPFEHEAQRRGLLADLAKAGMPE